jgi:hypothetical protein
MHSVGNLGTAGGLPLSAIGPAGPNSNSRVPGRSRSSRSFASSGRTARRIQAHLKVLKAAGLVTDHASGTRHVCRRSIPRCPYALSNRVVPSPWHAGA